MSDKPLVVFARRDPSRVGRLLSKPGKSLDVRWEDGSTETVVSGEFLQAPLGSSRFIQHVLPELWQELWSQDESATEVLVAMLAEQPNSVEWADLRKKATDLLPRGAIDQKRWDRLRGRLRKRIGVGSGPVTKLRLGPDFEVPSLLPADWQDRWGHVLNDDASPNQAGDPEVTAVAPAAEQRGADDAHDADADRKDDPDAASVPLTGTSAPTADSPADDESSDESAATETKPTRKRSRKRRTSGTDDTSEHPAAPETVPARTSRAASDVLAELKKVTTDGDAREGLLRELRSTDVSPLDAFAAELVFGGSVASDLANSLFDQPAEQLRPLTLSAQSVRAALGKLDAGDRRRACTSLLLTRDVLSRDLLAEWTADAESVKRLNALTRQVRALSPKELQVVLPQYARAVDGLTGRRAQSDASGPAVAPSADILKAGPVLSLLAEGGPACAPAADGLAQAMAFAVRERREPVESVAALKEPLSRLPLSSESGRFRLLAALPADDPATSSRDWLEGIGADDLLALSDADTTRLTRVNSWRERIAEIAEQAVAAASTRSRLLRLLSAGAVATNVATDTAVSAIRRVAGADASVMEWLRALGNREQIEALSGQVAQLEDAVEAASTELAVHRARAIEATERAQKLQSQLDGAVQSQGTAHDAVIVQAERDAYRALARILATVGSEARRLDADQLIMRLQQLVRIQGIEPIGAAGEELAFDPALHDAPGGRPAPGTSVHVGRPGYKWIREDAEEVLVKALVAVDQ
ncbi:hypothetical protein ACFC1W_07820 [Microbacterium sp. NPDC056003]|uniref:hypothetical protein n=1 Tax=Microbacterium sp. NPDC056003 TaxID=3345676 RepID=UPI0035DB71F4